MATPLAVSVARITDGGTALRKLLERELPSLVLLDIGLPGEDGFVLARWLRERSGRIGIIMVTAAADTVDRVVGLETGADDYIAKPFEPRELLARVKSVLRRTTGATANTGPRVRMGRRGNTAAYRCRVNSVPLIADESANYAYPWRDNFCEHRNFLVGQCPGGKGHQGGEQ